MSAVTVTLGGVAFQDMEVPDQIPVGGEQLAVVHRLIGGARVIDTMGRDDVALNWSGRFLAPHGCGRCSGDGGGERAPKAIGIRRVRSVHVIGPQDPRPHLDTGGAGIS